MRIITTTSNKRCLRLSRREWEAIGRRHGWLVFAATLEEQWAKLKRDYHLASPLDKPGILRDLDKLEKEIQSGRTEETLGDITLYRNDRTVDPDDIMMNPQAKGLSFVWFDYSGTLLAGPVEEAHIVWLTRMSPDALPWDGQAEYEQWLEDNGLEHNMESWKDFVLTLCMHEIPDTVSGRASEDGTLLIWDEMPDTETLQKLIASLPFPIKKVHATR